MSHAAAVASGVGDSRKQGAAHAPGEVPGQPDMWAFVIFEALIFSSYFVIYMICRAQSTELFLSSQEQLNQGFGVANTLILLSSSWFMAQCVQSAKAADYGAAIRQLFLTGGCGHLGLGGQEPAAYLVRYRGVSFLIDGLDHRQGLGWLLQVEQDVRLFSCGESEQAVVASFAGGPGGALEVRPCPGEPAHVDRLPSR